jgi:hypothetical protein
MLPRANSWPIDLRVLLLLLASLWLDVDGVQAQTSAADSLKQVEDAIAQHRLRIHNADSMGDARDAARFRIMLAPLCRPNEALTLYSEAAAIADSAKLSDDEALRARTGLAELLAARGDMRSAYNEQVKVTRLKGEWEARQAEVTLALEKIRMEAQLAERDSLLVRNDAALTAAREEVERYRTSSRRWIMATVATALLALVALIFMFYGAGQYHKRTLSELDGFRKEVEALKAGPRNRLREEPPTAAVPAPPPIAQPIATTATPVPEVERDELLVGMFRKMAPERLVTLREARARGDHEKVVRVVHSLKPQLVNLDAAYFGELCRSLVSAEGRADEAQWNKDLDRFERGLVEQLARI